jgi:hypothetical protein
VHRTRVAHTAHRADEKPAAKAPTTARAKPARKRVHVAEK